MKFKKSPLAALSCASILTLAAPSHADVLVSEDFTDSDGNLSGQNSGTGFSGGWNSSTNVTAGVATGTTPSSRSLSTPFPSSGTLWVSFDWGYAAKPSEGNSYGGLTFYEGGFGPGTERFLIGNTWPGSGHDVWQMNNNTTPTAALNYPGMKTGVAKITLGSGATSTVELWVGDAGSPVDVSGPPLATATGRDLDGVDGIRIGGVDFGSNNPQSFDNLLIGTTINDVDATDTPPTPTSATWTNTSGGEWNTDTNWLDNLIAFGSGNTAIFNTLNITADTTVNLDAPQTIGNLIFGDTDTASAAGWTLTNNSDPANILTLSGTTPTITVNPLGETKAATISTSIAGSSGLAKSGTGPLTLTAPINFTGPIIVNSGTLQINGQSYFNIGRPTTVASGAILELKDSNNDLVTLMPLSTVTGAGTFKLSGNSTINQSLNGISGTRLTISLESGGLIDLQDTSRLTNGGWQELNWTNNLADMNIAGDATFDLWDGQSVTIDALTGSGRVEKNHPGNSPTSLTVGIDDGSGTFSGTIANAQNQIALIKTGSGTQTLAGTNTYTGNTTVENGTLIISPTGSLRFKPSTLGQTNWLSGTESATLSYLGTVDLDLSGADTTNGNFWNIVDLGSFTGPTPTLTPAAITSTLGSFTQEIPGTWELNVTGAKWIFTEGDGTLVYTITATGYEIWGTPYGLTAGSEDGDLDHDGLTNFQEYAFGLIPNDGSSVNPITAPLDQTSGTFSYTRRTNSGLNYSIWFSENLTDWTEDTNAVESAPMPNGENETVEITLSNLPGNPRPAKLFIQVRAN
jgi:autotransporter-associated beta strand protein